MKALASHRPPHGLVAAAHTPFHPDGSLATDVVPLQAEHLAARGIDTKGAVGSSYNFAAPLYHELIAAWRSGDTDTARSLQDQSVAMIDAMIEIGYMGAAKAVLSERAARAISSQLGELCRIDLPAPS